MPTRLVLGVVSFHQVRDLVVGQLVKLVGGAEQRRHLARHARPGGEERGAQRQQPPLNFWPAKANIQIVARRGLLRQRAQRAQRGGDVLLRVVLGRRAPQRAAADGEGLLQRLAALIHVQQQLNAVKGDGEALQQKGSLAGDGRALPTGGGRRRVRAARLHPDAGRGRAIADEAVGARVSALAQRHVEARRAQLVLHFLVANGGGNGGGGGGGGGGSQPRRRMRAPSPAPVSAPVREG